ncbi:hypothetical protein D3C72_1788220 [compost metagenome]
MGFAPAGHGARAFAQHPQIAQGAYQLGAGGLLLLGLAGLAGGGVAVGVAGPVANQLLQPAVHGVGFGIHHFGLLGGWGLAIQSAWGSIPSITVWRPERKVVAVGAAALHGLRK